MDVFVLTELFWMNFAQSLYPLLVWARQNIEYKAAEFGVPRPLTARAERGRKKKNEDWGWRKKEGRKAVIRSWSRTDGRTGPAATRAALLLSSEQHILHSTTLNWEGTERDICSITCIWTNTKLWVLLYLVGSAKDVYTYYGGLNWPARQSTKVPNFGHVCWPSFLGQNISKVIFPC